ncbi:hypothetical protein GCM10009000_013170 [Halobacterium noricense]|uniref:Halobacterial output domain-containing protein n=1 Tax=Haladaptatus pallidirubidus TaxID=1008152 RepID=A0AAV3UB89_9EURY
MQIEYRDMQFMGAVSDKNSQLFGTDFVSSVVEQRLSNPMALRSFAVEIIPDFVQDFFDSDFEGHCILDTFRSGVFGVGAELLVELIDDVVILTDPNADRSAIGHTVRCDTTCKDKHAGRVA